MAGKARNLRQATPCMHVQYLDAAVDFMKRILGFTVMIRMTNGAYVVREGAAIRLLSLPEQWLPGNRRYAIYIDCGDVDALYAELKSKLDTLPKGHVIGPVNRPYEMRELLVLGPDGNFIAFSQPIDKFPSGEITEALVH